MPCLGQIVTAKASDMFQEKVDGMLTTCLESVEKVCYHCMCLFSPFSLASSAFLHLHFFVIGHWKVSMSLLYKSDR